MSTFRNCDWVIDLDLKEDLRKYVLRNFRRREILDFVQRDYPEYAWSLGTLSRRLRFFDIAYIDYNVTIEEINAAFRQEQNGPGQLLGYRGIHQKIREKHELAVPRGLVYGVMTNLDSEGLERRRNVGKLKKKRGPTGTFTSLGSNHTHSGDGHDKLMGFMRDTFPLAAYGLQDVFSSKILYLKLWMSNSNPKIVGRWYLEHLYKSKVISCRLRLDKGTETGHMATIHAMLRGNHEDVGSPENTVQYGPSTSNKIERWWRELHHRLEKYFKRQLQMLLDQGYYDPDVENDRYLLAFVFIPIIQAEMDTFCNTVWNSHRVRKQKDAQLPKGIPDHLYSFPEAYGAEHCGIAVTTEALDEVAEVAGVFAEGEDYLPPAVREECERIIPEINNVDPSDAAETFIFLKAHYNS